MAKKKWTLVAGISASTQSVTILVIDPWKGTIVYRGQVKYEELAEIYGAPKGYMDNGDGWVNAPPKMWIHAYELLFQAMKAAFTTIDEYEVSDIGFICGAGQQHGTVYLNANWKDAYRKVVPDHPLHKQLSGIFSHPTAPIWMDMSTDEQCELLAGRIGSANDVAMLTGSSPQHRFSGLQMLKIGMDSPAVFQRTDHVALVSSFHAGLLTLDHHNPAPLPYGDGSGTHLMDLQACEWSSSVLGYFDDHMPGLADKLPKLVPSNQVIGNIGWFYAARFGFDPNCQIIAFDGDNMRSLRGNGIYEPGAEILISRGTSDTELVLSTNGSGDPNGLGNVMSAGGTGMFMRMCCRKNGSLGREKALTRFDTDWEGLSSALAATPPGNDGQSLVLFHEREIFPATNGPVEKTFGGLDVTDRNRFLRALVEFQSLLIHDGLKFLGVSPERALVTGGGSVGEEENQVRADVLGIPVQSLEIVDPATGSPITDGDALGSALVAARVADPEGLTDAVLNERFCQSTKSPVTPKNAGAYDALRNSFAANLATAIG